MTDKQVTIETIINFFHEQVEKGVPLTPGIWLDGASKLNVLLYNLDDEMVDREMAYRMIRAGFIEDGKSAAESETRAKASDAYRDYLKAKAKMERCHEFINLAKKRVGLQVWES